MAGEPLPIAYVERCLLDAIEDLASGTDDALESLARIGEAMPGWMRAHLQVQHTIPSPSGILACRYQQWLLGKNAPEDQSVPTSWKYRRGVGILAEPYWLSVFDCSALHSVVLKRETLPCGVMQSHPDGILKYYDTTLELKNVTSWTYKRLIESPSLAASEPNAYAQLILNIHAAKTEWGLYLAAPADPSMLQKLMRGRRKYGAQYDLPVFYLEWVRSDPSYVEQLLERAEMIANDQLSDEPPPREYNAVTHKPDGALMWPCGYCRWSATCQNRYGIGLRGV